MIDHDDHRSNGGSEDDGAWYSHDSDDEESAKFQDSGIHAKLGRTAPEGEDRAIVFRFDAENNITAHVVLPSGGLVLNQITNLDMLVLGMAVAMRDSQFCDQLIQSATAGLQALIKQMTAGHPEGHS